MNVSCAMRPIPYHCLFRKPWNVPSASTLDILDNEFEACKVQGSDGIEGYIEQNKRPLKESVDGVGYTRRSATIFSNSTWLTDLLALCGLCAG